jgi:3-oxoacyl-[acyl-carrier protein] reductase
VAGDVGRVVLVTGGNRGIGLAIARMFAAAGDRVAVTSRSGPVDRLMSVPCDVTDPESVDKALSAVETELGPVEVLVANAGVNDDKLLLQMDDDSFERVVDTNLVGSFRVVRRALPKMLRARKGRVVLISSVVALSGSPGQANYGASKAGLIGFARSLAREIGSRNVTVNVVAPGFIETDMTAGLDEDRQRDILSQVPLRRFGSAEDVAGTVYWLSSESAGYVTGAVIPVDGGLGMGH